MEAAIFHHHLHLLPRSNQNDVVSSMRLGLIRDLSLKRPSAYHSIPAPDNPRSQRRTKFSLATMSTKKDETKETPTDNTEKNRSLPPPPEKPEPGDCCGSGCVRCVWDVYFDQLDAYDKLCKSISDESKSS